MDKERSTDYDASYYFLERKYKEKINVFQYRYKYQSWLVQTVGAATYFLILAFVVINVYLKDVKDISIQDAFERILGVNLMFLFPLLLVSLIYVYCLRLIIIKKYLVKDYLNESWVFIYFLIQFMYGALIIALFLVLVFLYFFL